VTHQPAARPRSPELRVCSDAEIGSREVASEPRTFLERATRVAVQRRGLRCPSPRHRRTATTATR
jgi:hypothetical protein